MNIEKGQLMAEARATSGLTQKQMAEGLNRNQTHISRIEAGDGDDADNAAYLAALNTPEAHKLDALFKLPWTNLPQPSLRHPDLDTLVAVESALGRVRAFLGGGQISAVLAGQAQLLDRRLEEAGRYLLSLDHEVVYVGDTGIGKTTAACRQAGLVTDEATAADLKGMMLDTGGGRTTLCDVRVQTGERFALAVEPVHDEEIYRLIGEICSSVFEKGPGGPAPSMVDFRPPEEVERTLRNMAKLPRPVRTRKGVATLPDPAAELAKKFDNLDAFIAEFAAKLCLWRRTRRTAEFDGADEKAGRQWLRTLFTDINNGRTDDFSLPGRITVTVPFALVANARLSVTLVDTRGVDGSAVRPDIVSHLKDSRAVTLLCSKWGSAPDPSAQTLLTHVNETDADPALPGRVAIVALARTGDALSMRHDSGEGPQDVAEGYEIKLGHIEDALQRAGLAGVEAFAYNAGADEPAALAGFVLGRIRAVRRTQVDAATATIAAIDEMIANLEQATALAALGKVNGDLARFAARHAGIRAPRRAASARLLQAVETLHPRIVWAATRRAGRYWNFDVFQYLGDGAAAEAKARSGEVVAGLNEIIAADLDNPGLATARGFLTQVRADAAQWEADFVNAARHHSTAVYLWPLGRAQELWAECERAYGSGAGGYREGVLARLSAWFDGHETLREELERRIARAWETSFIDLLRRAAGQGEKEGAAGAGQAGPDAPNPAVPG
jgi:transcriptional regulator with XRE-family HTH domain